MNKKTAHKIAKAILANEAINTDGYVNAAALDKDEKDMIMEAMTALGQRELKRLGVEPTGNINILIAAVRGQG